MADNYEHHGQDEPHPGSAPEGDFPADFFDDVAEPSPVSLTPSEPPAPPSRPHEPPPVAKAPPDDVPPPIAIGPPSAYRAPDVTPVEDEGIKMSAFPVVLGLVMLGLLVAAWFVSKQQAPPAVATTPPASAPSTVASEAPSPTPAVVAIASAAEPGALEGKIKDLAGKFDELSAQVKAFEEKFNDLPKPAPAPDIKPLEGKLSDLAKSVAAVAPLKDKVGKLDEKVGSVDGSLKSIKDEIGTLKDELHKVAAAPPAASEAKPAADDSATALGEGADLFKAGKYKEANEVFKKLASGNPKDARVYYYAALTRGLTTNDWQGETLSTAGKGAELEKAGSPKASEIDSSFADLPSTLKPWVTFFRKQAK